MCISETTCEYDGEIYKIVSDLLGASSDEADALKREYEAKGYKVHVDHDEIYPDVHPKGAYFVYAKK
ncbi:hypothetical protein J2755_001346 [Methanohalophilus levihalophilus]|uniref:hypothetical protein n=1 Tax=Methanohalophilus levihalophilus TaxID=1431282 RepID=UPI001AE60570|nr:hypothetical protein [Methanohalophilus levihalophilus]MBP2030412.1 hypothetical protein [Methanohalophilus levihalophilus]